MRRLRRRLALGLLSLVVVGGCVESLYAQEDAEQSPFGGNRFCGPMCLQRTLEHYGLAEELVDLIYEVQWPEPEKGTSFASLSEALGRRGIQTRAIEVQSLKLLEWPSPAIVQLGLRNSKHFVVWLPSENGREARIWDGSQSLLVRKSDIDSLLDGPVLLTSQSDIPSDIRVGIAHPTRPTSEQTALAALLGLGAGIFLARRRTGRAPE